ncbi:methylsterol monooxygenase 1-2-like isoform X4 [Salvia hispanica]|uniref:methylsterol monooxygenase 1-2-like isoform X4 n=1 Tax=Salvia hispanica TaxID=49212 RepID=UPI00200973AA|nr:methylsterol monooxygenase 1-2-like isoform X4 [Salvia hispanica]
MLPYATIHDAEAALGRSLSNAETVWFNYSATKSDYILYCHNIIFLFIIFSLFPFYYLFLEYFFTNSVAPFKIQPKVKLSFSDTLHCYKSVMRMFFLVVGPLQLVSYPSILIIGIRTGLPLPSLWEIALQLGVYFLVEDYTNYWVHRFLHCKWGYEKIHKVHHEYTAPIGFAAPYAHWAEILILGIPSFLGPAMVPGHMITFWLWIALRQIEAIETHSGIIVNQMKLITSSFHCRGEAVSIKFLERSCVQMEKEWKDVVCLSYECWLGMTSLGLRRSIFHFTVAQITMITITMLVDRAKVTSHQYSPIAIISMALIRKFFCSYARGLKPRTGRMDVCTTNLHKAIKRNSFWINYILVQCQN